MIACVFDQFISQIDCHNLITYYENNESKSFQFRDVFPLTLNKDDPEIKSLANKLNTAAKKISNSQIDWFEIVKWPTNSFQKLHIDNASNQTTLASILYLNDTYTGGETYFEDNTIFTPTTGRIVFFDSTYFKHGVKKINMGTRFVIAAWYKQ